MNEKITKLVKRILPLSFAMSIIAVILSITSTSLSMGDYSIWELASEKSGNRAVDGALVMGAYIPILNLVLSFIVMFLQYGQYILLKQNMKVEYSANVFILTLSVIILAMSIGSIVCATNATDMSWLIKHGENFY